MRDDNYDKTESVFALLEEATSLDVVREFLRGKGLHHSAGKWSEMREKRLIPYLADHTITLDDLIQLLTTAEECGDQHIFLFRCASDATEEMLDRARTHAALRAANLEHLIEGPSIERRPTSPTIVEVRWQAGQQTDLSMTIKEAEVRTKRVLKRERPRGKYFVKIYEDKPVRAINLAKLHREGFLEIRIQSRDNTTKYDGDVIRFLRQINNFFPLKRFAEISLSTAKDTMWQRRAELINLIRYTDASVIDEEGNTVKAATGSDNADLGQSAAGQSVDFILRADQNAYCSESNLWFQKSDHLSRPIHVLLNGASNEFAITKKCSAEDYEYVLNQIRHFNR